MKRFIGYVFLTAAVFLLFSCDLFGEKETEPEPEGIDFTSHNTGYSILVRNNTSERLIAFKGDLLESKLIGGVPSRATNHGLPKDPALFDKTEDFPMVILTEAQYNANKDNLNSLKNTPFTRVYVFFNKSGDNTIVYEIADGLGGNNEFKIINASNSINVELRLGGAAGETIGYAPAGILETTLKLQDGNYNIFPVFKRYNAFRDVVETVYPQGSGSNYAWFESYSFGEGTTTATMNLKNLLQNINFVLGAAWVYVDNQTTGGGIRFVEGSNVRATATGLENIMSGAPKTFQIDMPKAGNNTYADSTTVSNWKFGATGFEVGLQTGENDSTPLSSLKIDQGKMYTITVSGSHNDNSLKAWVSNATEIPQNELSGTW
jgi:hypothetical protein